MSGEWSSSVVERARRYAALGEPARLAIAERLLLGDASPSELGRELELPSNLLAHHLKLLEQAGLVERSRSEGDHRRSYVRLRAEILAGLVPARLLRAPRVVFVCSQNSARSQLAAALWQRRSRIPAASAGTCPAPSVHPLAVSAAQAHGLPLTPTSSTSHLDDVLRADDLVVAVCDNAHEQLGRRRADRLHWSVADPAPVGTDDAFAAALRTLVDRIDRLAPAVHPPGEHDD